MILSLFLFGDVVIMVVDVVVVVWVIRGKLGYAAVCS